MIEYYQGVIRLKIYISQLIETIKIKNIISEYNVGLELINFSIAENLDNIDKTMKQENDALNIDCSYAMHGPFFDLMPASYDSLIKNATLTRFNQAYEIAKKLNVDHIIFHTGYLKDIYYYEGWLENSITFWTEFLSDKDDDIQIYLENVFEDNFDSILTLLNTINNPKLNLCLDLGHANIKYKNNLDELIIKLSKYLKHIHIHNNDGILDQHNEINQGTINYNNIFKTIKDNNINVNFTLEMSSSTDIKTSLDYINNYYPMLK